jgi:subtilisin family serine protease
MVAATVATASPAAASAADGARPSVTKQPLSVALAKARGQVNVLVEVDGTSATTAYARNRSRGAAQARAAAREAQSQSADKVSSLKDRLASKGKVLYSTTRVLPGVALRTDAANLRSIAALPGVARVVPLTAKQRTNARADEVTRALDVWHDLGNTGEGVTVGIIDTGIDYTHTDFGGGGVADFTANDRTHIPSDGSAYASDVAFPTAKVVSGYDFAGDAYDGNNFPSPDSDPVDCASEISGNDGHGTHVAGTAAGFGVNANGSTFTGDYSTLTATQAAALNVGPGAAPKATLSALRVFGCDGGTLLVTQALDYVAGLNTDADPANDVQIVNLSLGSAFTRSDDPDAQAIDAIADLGVLPVLSAGNSGDLFAASGSPGSARKALSVAATDDGVDTVDGVQITDDSGTVIYPATNSIAYPYRSQPADNTGLLVKLTDPTNLDGCGTFSSADAAAVAGKYAFLEWDDSSATRRCGSVGRSGKAKAAGAVGAVFGSNTVRFSAGITGDADIPVTMTNKTGADAIRTALTAGQVVTATFGFNFRAGTPQGAKVIDLPSTDKIADFTSRGGTPADGYLKPDVGAPGLHTFSANSGTGNEGHDLSGTSMASPHTAGTAALVLAAHPTWRPEQVKADIMNTAAGLLTTDGHGAGTPYTVSRVGAGRIDGRSAVANDVLAYVLNDPGAVGLGFGPVAVTGPTTRTKTVQVENLGGAARTFALSYASAQDVPGVTFEMPASVVVAAGATTTFDVTMRVTSVGALRKTPDPTLDLTQGGEDRQFIAEENGRILLTEGATTLRLPAAVAVRPASTISAASSTVGVVPTAGNLAAGTVALTGQGVQNGALGDTDSVNSLVGGFQLQASSPALNACLPGQVDGCITFPSQRAGDLKYVGATATDDLLGIALTTHGTWSQPAYNPTASGAAGEVAFVVLIDTDGNGSQDREIDVTRLAPDTDIYVAETYNLVTGDVVDDQPVNSVPASVDTNTINSNALVLPVSRAALGLAPGRSTIRYTIATFSLDDAGAVLDTVGPLDFDLAHPQVTVPPQLDGTLLSEDVPGSLPVVRDTTNLDTQNLGLMLLHLHNTDAAKAEVLSVQTAADPKLSTYTPLDPVRLLDTRPGAGNVGAPAQRVGAGGVIDVPVGGVSGVPADATAVVLNVTAVRPTANSDVKVFASGAATPSTSNLNTRPGVTIANLVVAPLGDAGKVRIRNNAGATDLLADVQGFYRSGTAGSGFSVLTPVRVLDTRPGAGNRGAAPTRVAGGKFIDLKVAGVNGVPAGATAVALNVTAVSPSADGDVRVFPTPGGGAVGYPVTSNLNVVRATTSANLVVVRVGEGGKVRMRVSAGSTDLLADLAGFFLPASGGQYVAVDPTRLLDTRPGRAIGGPAGVLPAGGVRDVQVTGLAGIPDTAKAVVLNLTGVGASGPTDVRAYPTPASGSGFPNVSNLNLRAGITVPNLVVVGIGEGGKVRLRNSSSPVHLVADVQGYYTG